MPREWRCDSDDDCGDNSDETLAVCQQIDCPPETKFRCQNLKCIPRWRLCNKVNDCGDGSDENNHALCKCELSAVLRDQYLNIDIDTHSTL